MDLADVDERRSSLLTQPRLTSRGRQDGELAIGLTIAGVARRSRREPGADVREVGAEAEARWQSRDEVAGDRGSWP